jgi:hypothetical protein
MSKIQKLIAPIDWKLCKIKYPRASAAFIRAIHNPGMAGTEKTAVQADAMQARSQILKSIKMIDTIPEEELRVAMHWATVAYGQEQTLEMSYHSIRNHMSALASGLDGLALSLSPKYGQKAHVKDALKHEICATLSLLFALDRGTHPTCGIKATKQEANCEFGEALQRALIDQHAVRIELGLPKFIVGNLFNLSKPHLSQLKKSSIQSLRTREASHYDCWNLFAIADRELLKRY